MEVKEYLWQKKEQIDVGLEAILSSADFPVEPLAEGVRCAVFPGGKRIRPILTMAGHECVGGECPDIVPIACSVELVHCYSLVHDDLPAMDDSDLRRGLPAVHKVVGEGMAVLVGDELLTLAFETLANLRGIDDHKRTRLVCQLAEVCGTAGLIGGQALDLDSEQKDVPEGVVHEIARRKTGALIEASVAMGGIAGDANDEELASLRKYGASIGLAFQVMDDLLDAEGDQDTLGKSVRSDEEKGKASYPFVLGVERSRKLAEQLTNEAVGCLSDFGETAQPLREIALLLSRRRG
jgi:geranylgeranyl diphosphate synthase type II